MNTIRTNVVDAFRLAPPEWEKGKRSSEGDIRASYSADTIAWHSKVRKPFRWRGEAWVAVCLSGNGGVEEAEAVRLIPAELFQDATTTYAAISCRSRPAAERASRAPTKDFMGFYHGVKVTHGGVAYVLSGPAERFVAGTPSYFEDADFLSMPAQPSPF